MRETDLTNFPNTTLPTTSPVTTFPATNLPCHIANLVSVRTGKAQPFTREQTSAINKAPIKAPVAVNALGLVTDEQADLRNHGGPQKAVHQMAPATYARINTEFDLKVSVGTLGENLTTEPVDGMPDMLESTVCIGDVFQYAHAQDGDNLRLRVVQPRRPCYKINDQIGHLGKLPNIASWLSKQGIPGWYFAVVNQGIINKGMPVYLVERPYPFATLEKLWMLSNLKTKVDADVIQPWLDIDCLHPSWKKVLTKKIQKKL